MSTLSVTRTSIESRRRPERLAYAALLAMGAAISIACQFFPANLPFWMPWEFSWPVFLVTSLSLSWFVLGLPRLPVAERPGVWRRVSFVAGVLFTYAVLQTHVDYYAQHMFFVHLDHRPHPPARLGFGWRALLVVAVEPLQMALGAVLSLSSTDYYPVYRICGRIWDIAALSDQHYGGLIVWLPSTLTSLAGVICVLVVMRVNEERPAHV